MKYTTLTLRGGRSRARIREAARVPEAVAGQCIHSLFQDDPKSKGESKEWERNPRTNKHSFTCRYTI